MLFIENGNDLKRSLCKQQYKDFGLFISFHYKRFYYDKILLTVKYT